MYAKMTSPNLNQSSMSELTFAGKVALITGSGRGIGRELALYFARQGADVVVNFFRNRAAAEQTADEVRGAGCRALVIKANVGNLEQLATLFTETETAMGGLDIYIHNAASGYNRAIMEQKARGWEWTMNINARSLLFGAQHAARLMSKRGGGSIVALSSLGAARVLPEYAVVGASKAAIESLVRYLAVELAPLNIRVNAVSPGLVRTGALDHFELFREEEGQYVADVAERTPAGRLCLPADVADLVGFLCGPAAAMLRGQTIILDGGYSLLVR